MIANFIAPAVEASITDEEQVKAPVGKPLIVETEADEGNSKALKEADSNY